MHFISIHSALLALSLLSITPARSETINVDFSRDISGSNPGTNLADVVANTTGIAPDTGTVWNDFSVKMVSNLIPANYALANLVNSTGTATTITVTLTNNASSFWYRAFNSTVGTANNISREWLIGNDPTLPGIITVSGLAAGGTYDFYLVGGGSFATNFTIGASTEGTTNGSGQSNVSLWVEGTEYVKMTGTADGSGNIAISVKGNGQVNGTIAAMQIVENSPPPVMPFLYPDSASTTGGEFNATNYSPLNLINDGFDSSSDTINASGSPSFYPAPDNNYASASGTTENFNLTFEFSGPASLNGFHVWNYVFHSSTGGGSTSPNFGVNAYTLTFYNGPAGTGSQIGSVFNGNLAPAVWGAANAAQTVNFNTNYPNVRSVVMRVVSNHGGTFTGMNELAFNGTQAPPANAIVSFASSAPFVQKPALPTLTWEVTGDITSLQLGNSEQGVIDVTGITTGGIGSLEVSPLGDQSYTLTLNGTITATLKVVGLPPSEKLHIYLLMGQSNMQGTSGSPVLNDGTHDPIPRIIKFGSRVGMEQQFVTGGHPLTSLSSQSGGSVSAIGMGLEFAKTLLAAEADPEVVICLINHALGSTAIQYWQPDAIAQDGTKLYNNAIQRTLNAANFGVVKGVLWHQGEYNCNATQTNPSPEPELYDDYLNDLVDNVRDVFNNPGLPFICGKLSPNHSFSGDRTTVEAALSSLPGRRSNTFCVDNNGLSGKVGDTIHFDENSQLLLGQRYAAAMLGFYGNPFLLHMGAYLSPVQLANPLLTDPSGDNDADGTSNYLEFAFLTNPMNREATPSSSGGVIAVPPGGEFPMLSFRKRSDTEAPPYIIEVSDNMRTWTSNLDGGPPVTETVGAPVTNGDGTSTVTVRSLAPVSPANPRQFLRLAVPSN